MLRAQGKITLLSTSLLCLMASCATIPRASIQPAAPPTTLANAIQSDANIDATAAALLAGPPEEIGPPYVAPDPPATTLIARALSLLGVRYRYGGNAPDRGFDCSGFVRYVYRAIPGVELPRASWAMSKMPLPNVTSEQLSAGDLVFFRGGRNVSHVGMYIGDGEFVHAPSRGHNVRVDKLSDRYWKRHYAGAKRVIGAMPALSAATASQ